MKRTARNAAILLGAFLLGIVPPLIRTMQLKKELAAANSRLDFGETRELAALSYLEVSRNNFGVAAQHASLLFERLGVLSTSAEEPVRSVAIGATRKRDALMGMLATADPAARIELQQLLSQLISTTNETGAGARKK